LTLIAFLLLGEYVWCFFGRWGGIKSGSNGSAILVTADRDGSVVGWRSDGGTSLDMVFHHELKDTLTSLAFPPPPVAPSEAEVNPVPKRTFIERFCFHKIDFFKLKKS